MRSLPPKPHRILIASKNDGKIKEIKNLLNFPGIKLLTYKDFEDWPEVEEEGDTYRENAELKAITVAQRFNLPTVADDSGLEVKALGGAPGKRSARYAGVGTSDEQRVAKILKALAGASSDERDARFRCVAVYAEPSGSVTEAEGTCPGTVATKPAGTGGFGYDPVFIPDGYDRTIAQLPESTKNGLSHRGQAFSKLKRILETVWSEPD